MDTLDTELLALYKGRSEGMEKELNKINDKIVLEIKTAVDFALESPFPDESELYTNVYI